jgi:hypothetical protein
MIQRKSNYTGAFPYLPRAFLQQLMNGGGWIDSCLPRGGSFPRQPQEEAVG